MNEQHSLLRIDEVTTAFPGVRALDNVTFSVLAAKSTASLEKTARANLPSRL